MLDTSRLLASAGAEEEVGGACYHREYVRRIGRHPHRKRGERDDASRIRDDQLLGGRPGQARDCTAAVVDPFGNVLGVMYNPHYLEVLRAEEQG